MSNDLAGSYSTFSIDGISYSVSGLGATDWKEFEGYIVGLRLEAASRFSGTTAEVLARIASQPVTLKDVHQHTASFSGALWIGARALSKRRPDGSGGSNMTPEQLAKLVGGDQDSLFRLNSLVFDLSNVSQTGSNGEAEDSNRPTSAPGGPGSVPKTPSSTGTG